MPLHAAAPVLVAGLVLQAHPPAVAARYLLDGRESVVSMDDLALEMGRRFRRTEQGKRALESLIGHELVRQAARRAGLLPTGEETDRWIGDLEEKLRSRGLELGRFLERKGMTLGEFREYAALSLAHERVVRRAAGLRADEPVTPDMLALWLKEARGKEHVEIDEKRLPRGVVARVGERSLTLLDLGRLIVRGASVAERRRYTRQIVLRRCLEALARKHGLTVTPREMRAEVAARAAAAARDPRLQAVPFDQILEAQGTSREELAHSGVLRAQVLERKLAYKLYPDEEIRRRLADDRESVLARHGARRRLQVLLVAARKDGKGRHFEQARALCEQVRVRILKDLPFAEAARTYSDEPYTKVAGGDAGWHNREGSKLPREVVDAAFHLDINEVSRPIRTERGYWLVRVAAIEPEPNEATLAARLRRALTADLRRKILAEAKVRLAW